jgi:ribonuclease Z
MSSFQVTILGCSSATPTNDRHPSAQVVNVLDQLILIDCGEGTQTQLLRYGIRLGRIGHICISHLHGDHFLGLPGLLSTMSLNGRTTPLVLICSENLKSFLDHFFQVSDTFIRFEIKYIFTNPEQDEWVYAHEMFRVKSFPMKHRVPCTGFVISENRQARKIDVQACEELGIPIESYILLKQGADYTKDDGTTIPNHLLTTAPTPTRTYAYCSDTIYDEELCEHIKWADMLYHEATFQEDRAARATETFHSTASQAGRIAKKAEVKKLIIGHFSARYNDFVGHLKEAKQHFEHTELALEGQTFNI